MLHFKRNYSLCKLFDICYNDDGSDKMFKCNIYVFYLLTNNITHVY